MRWFVVFAIGCGGTAKPADPTAIENKAAPTATEPVATECRPRGVVFDASIGEQAIGATVVFSGSIGERVAISDEKGQFSIPIDNAHNRITVYYNDRSFEWPFQPSYCYMRIRITLDPPNVPPSPIVAF